MIKVIAFDYAGVVAPGLFSSWLGQSNVNKDIGHKYFEQYSKRWDMGEVDLEGYYKLISEMSGVAPELIWNTFFENSIYNEDVVKIIKKLKQKYKVVLFSNNFSDALCRRLEKHKIANLFDEIIISSEYKMMKPSREFFRVMLSIVKANKNETVFIDDKILNVDASNKLGIKAFLFTNAKALSKDLSDIGIKI